jgi:hypothetical protein
MEDHGGEPKIQHMAPQYPSITPWRRHPSQNGHIGFPKFNL